MDNNKFKKAQEALQNDLYRFLDELDVPQGETEVDMEDLADILKGYESINLEEEQIKEYTNQLDDILIDSKDEVVLEVDEEKIIKEYNKDFTPLGDNTIKQMREVDEQFENEISAAEADAQNDIDRTIKALEELTRDLAIEEEQSLNLEEELIEENCTQTIISPEEINIDDFDENSEYLTQNDLDSFILPHKQSSSLEEEEIAPAALEVEPQETEDIPEPGTELEAPDINEEFVSTIDIAEDLIDPELEKSFAEEEAKKSSSLTPLDYLLILIIIVCVIGLGIILYNRFLG